MKNLLILGFFAIFYVQTVVGQTTAINQKHDPRLMETLTDFKGDESSLVIDLLRNEVEREPTNRGLIVVYCGRTCKYGEIEAHLRGITFALEFKRLDPPKYSIMFGGYKEKTSVEFWVVTDGSRYPRINSEIRPSEIRYKGNYPRKLVEYDCC